MIVLKKDYLINMSKILFQTDINWVFKQYLIGFMENYDVNYMDIYGGSILSSAIDNNLYYFIELLLINGANPNVFSRFDNSPLMIAIYEDNKYVIKLLLEHGANPYLKNKSGLSAIDIAFNMDKIDLVKVMKYSLK